MKLGRAWQEYRIEEQDFLSILLGGQQDTNKIQAQASAWATGLHEEWRGDLQWLWGCRLEIATLEQDKRRCSWTGTCEVPP